MARRGAERPGLIDWMVLGAAVLLASLFLMADASGRLHAARFLRQTLLRPYRVVLGYHGCPPDPWNEVRRLRLELAERSLDRARLEEMERENGRLRDLLDFRAQDLRLLAPALVVGRGSDRFGEVVALARPEGATILPGQTVIGLGGLVGAVLDADGREVRVRTVRNGALRVSGMLEESRCVGLLRWRAAEGIATLEGIALDVEVKEGEGVVTSGYGRVFPKGVPIGTVVGVADDSTALARSVRVRLGEDLDRLEEVFLIED